VYLQGTLGWSALRSGLAFLPFVAAIALGVHATSQTVARLGSRVLVAGGMTLAALGALLLSQASDHAGYATELLPGFVVLGLGLGLAFPAVSITAMSDVRHESAGLASGLLSTAHEVGAALGVAVLSALAAGPRIDYDGGTLAAAIAAGALTLLAAAVVPAVRPPAGSHAAMH
jgi:fucose permease